MKEITAKPDTTSNANARPKLVRSTSNSASAAVMSEEAMNLSFLWQAYKPKYWYWELIETARRILLTAVLSVCAPGSSKQNVLGLLAAYFFTKLYGYFQPYAEDSDFNLSELGQTQIVLTFFATLVYKQKLLGDEWESAIGVVLIVVNLSVIFVGFYYEVLAYLEDNQEIANYASQKISNVSQEVKRVFTRFRISSDNNEYHGGMIEISQIDSNIVFDDVFMSHEIDQSAANGMESENEYVGASRSERKDDHFHDSV
jgi:hypothetical protein